MKYGVGDVVILKTELEPYKQYGGYIFTTIMENFKGRPLEITTLYSDCYEVKQTSMFVFTDEMIADKITLNLSDTWCNIGVTISSTPYEPYSPINACDIKKCKDEICINEKGGNDMEKILKKYEDNKTKKIIDDFDTKIAKLEEKSVLNNIGKQVEDLIIKELQKNKILQAEDTDFRKYFNFIVLTFNDENLKKECDILEEEKREEKQKVKEEMEIIRACLEPCETYEQKIAVLKTYNVLDSNGKINI